MTPAATERFVTLTCPLCQRSLRAAALAERALRCPGCGCPVRPPEPPPTVAPKTPVRPAGPQARTALWLAALLPAGVPLLTGTSTAGLSLAGALVGLGLLLAWGPRPRPALRLALSLLAAAAGYAAAAAFLRPGLSAPASPGDASPPHAPRMLRPPHPPPGVRPEDLPPVTDLHFVRSIGALMAVAIDPDARAALVLRADGTVDAYSYPQFTRRAAARLDRPAYRAALDGRAGRLWVASCPAEQLRASRYGDRPTGRADLRAYDVRALLEGTSAATPLRPEVVIALDADVANLMLSVDRESLYYLAQGTGGAWVGRVATRAPDAGLRRELPGAVALAQTPDGRSLCAVAPGRLSVLAPQTLEVVRTLSAPASACDVVMDNTGRAFVAERGQWASITVLDAAHDGATLALIPSHLYGQVYLQLSPGGRRLYVSASSPIVGALRSLLVVAEGLHREPPQIGQAGNVYGAMVLGETFLASDGKFLVTRRGAVYQLVKLGESGNAARPRRQEGQAVGAAQAG